MKTSITFKDATRTTIVIGLIEVAGFIKGDGWSVEPLADEYGSILGLGGAVVPIKSYDPRAMLTIKLMATSPCNFKLSLLRNADDLIGKAVLPVVITDTLNDDYLISTGSRCIRKPAIKSSGPREWKFELYNLNQVLGGQ
jgi:hypothetical protein